MTDIVIGIDPGLNNTGWGVIKVDGSSVQYLASGVIKTSAQDNLSHRINSIFIEVSKLLESYKPDQFVIEETFVNKNPLSSMKLGYARASSILAAAQKKIPITEYSAKHVKKTIVGNGAADKKQIAFMLKTLLPKASPRSDDESDALAIALSYRKQSIL